MDMLRRLLGSRLSNFCWWYCCLYCWPDFGLLKAKKRSWISIDGIYHPTLYFELFEFAPLFNQLVHQWFVFFVWSQLFVPLTFCFWGRKIHRVGVETPGIRISSVRELHPPGIEQLFPLFYLIKLVLTDYGGRKRPLDASGALVGVEA